MKQRSFRRAAIWVAALTCACAPRIAQPEAPGSLSSRRLKAHLPEWLQSGNIGQLEIWQWLGLVLGIAVAFALGYVLERLMLGVARRLARLTAFQQDDDLVVAAKGPGRFLLFALLLAILTRWLHFPEGSQSVADLLGRGVAIASFAWFVLRVVKLLAGWIERRVTAETPTDIGRVRGIRTQLTVMRHVVEVAVGVIAAALVLMQFEVVRSVGVSLLASAGIAGLVIGLAAQKSIGSLLAGIQLSITQPIRIGDTVIVEGEFATVEEVRLTYAVLKTWDLRRLIVPIIYFLEKPFQNWSKVSPELIGDIKIRVDFTTDVGALRSEFRRILEHEGRELFDGRTQVVHVIDADDRVMTVRLLVSAADPGKLFDLRALVREKMVAWVAAHPDWLPVRRTDTRNRVVEAPGEMFEEPRVSPSSDSGRAGSS